MSLLDWLTPWEFSPVLLLTFLLVIALYVRGGKYTAPIFCASPSSGLA